MARLDQLEALLRPVGRADDRRGRALRHPALQLGHRDEDHARAVEPQRRHHGRRARGTDQAQAQGLASAGNHHRRERHQDQAQGGRGLRHPAARNHHR